MKRKKIGNGKQDRGLVCESFWGLICRSPIGFASGGKEKEWRFVWEVIWEETSGYPKGNCLLVRRWNRHGEGIGVFWVIGVQIVTLLIRLTAWSLLSLESEIHGKSRLEFPQTASIVGVSTHNDLRIAFQGGALQERKGVARAHRWNPVRPLWCLH